MGAISWAWAPASPAIELLRLGGPHHVGGVEVCLRDIAEGLAVDPPCIYAFDGQRRVVEGGPVRVSEEHRGVQSEFLVSVTRGHPYSRGGSYDDILKHL